MASQRLKDLFSAEHGVDRAALQKLEPEDFRELREWVRGRVREPHRARAMRVLVDATGVEAVRPLAAVVRDPKEDRAFRAAAASELARAGPGAEPALVEALGEDDPTVAIAAAGALAKVGSLATVPQLDKVAEAASDDALARQARFAASVVSFRNREPGHEPPPGSEDELLGVPQRERLPVVMRPARPAEARTAVRDLARDTYGVALVPQMAFVTCAPERMVVCLDGDGLRGDLGDAFSTPLLVGLVARREPVERTFTVRWLILAWPSGDGKVELAVHRPSGERFLSGEGVLEARRGEFTVRSVRGRGNQPVELTGTVEAGRLASLAGMAGPSRPERGEPTPIDRD